MEQGGQAASCAGISGGCGRDTCNYRAFCFSVCVGVTGVISPTGLALNVLAECRGSLLYCIPQSVLGNGQTDVLRTDPNLLSKLAAAPWSLVELTNQPPAPRSCCCCSLRSCHWAAEEVVLFSNRSRCFEICHSFTLTRRGSLFDFVILCRESRAQFEAPFLKGRGFSA